MFQVSRLYFNLLMALSQATLLCSLWTACSSPQQDSDDSDTEELVNPDLSRLPANLRRRLTEGESRIKALKRQQSKLQSQVTQLEKLETRYKSDPQSSTELLEEAKSRISEAHQNLELVSRSLSEMSTLVERIKLQALADEMQLDRKDDQKLKTMLKNAVEVYDEEAELTTLQQEAELGKAEAQFKLGKRFEKGTGVDQSDVEALSWYLKASSQGHEKAYLAIGYFYRHGRGTKVDLDQAKVFYKKAAELGNLTAANNLALIYLNGAIEKASPSEVKLAKPWLVMAASGGKPRSQLELAKLYLAQVELESKPQGTAYSKARKLLIKASKSRQKSVSEQAKKLLSKQVKSVESKLITQSKAKLKWTKIPAGHFLMGNPEGKDDAKITRTIHVAGFDMLSHEVTVADYKACVLAGACSSIMSNKKACHSQLDNNLDYPINCVSWQQARDFAHWVGGELPSEVQWEYAARSAGQFTRYPWGKQDADCERAVMRKSNSTKKSSKLKGCGKGTAWPICSKSSGISQQGLCDMIGNVWEWTLDEYRPNYDRTQTNDEAVCITPNCKDRPKIQRVIRGGGYMTKVAGANATMRSKSNRAAVGIGFRVVKSLD